jgi:hypothetical protein
MSADGNLLRGEINPEVISSGSDVETFLFHFLNSLIKEANETTSSTVVTSAPEVSS